MERQYVVLASMKGVFSVDYEWTFTAKMWTVNTLPGTSVGFGPKWAEEIREIASSLGRDPESNYRSLKSVLGRCAVVKGTPDWRQITDRDLDEFEDALSRFEARPNVEELRTYVVVGGGTVGGFARSQRSHLYATRLMLYAIGQTNTPPKMSQTGTKTLISGAPPRIQAVFDRYLKWFATTHRSSTVSQTNNSLSRFAIFFSKYHPEIEVLDQLNRELVEEWLEWLPTYTNEKSGHSIGHTALKNNVSQVNVFLRHISQWEWADTPARPLLSSIDIPKKNEALPRFIPRADLDKIHTAILACEDPFVKAALLVLRWVGPRRGEVRRLEIDALDTYSDGYPRLRIPAGKTYQERIVPLHPEAAEALKVCIEITKAQNLRPLPDEVTDQDTRYIFQSPGVLMTTSWLFDRGIKMVCDAADLRREDGHRPITSHRFRHTVGTQLAEDGARLQTIMAILGHKSAAMSMVYSAISDSTIRSDYERALSAGEVIAGPAATEILQARLSDSAVDWLKNNYYKTSLELGHCLRVPEEGPCECDLYLTCSKFLTTPEYVPRIKAKIRTEKVLGKDAVTHGWEREIERHAAMIRRLECLLTDMGVSSDS